MDVKEDITYPKLSDAISRLFKSTKAIITNMISLATLEFQLAVRSVLIIFSLIIITIILFTSAWLCLLAAFIIWLASLHVSWLLAILAAMCINLLLIPCILFIASRYGKNLQFSATRRQLKFYGENDGIDQENKERNQAA